jgi:hypothetical protein
MARTFQNHENTIATPTNTSHFGIPSAVPDGTRMNTFMYAVDHFMPTNSLICVT